MGDDASGPSSGGTKLGPPWGERREGGPATFDHQQITSGSNAISFESIQIGATPDGWTATLTGSGEPKWTVESDETAPSKSKVLKQSGRATYPLILKNDTNIKDGFVEVKFKAIAGSQDRAAGIVWRAKDANNYYVTRANALEDNVVLYKTVKRHPQPARHCRPEGRLWNRC